MGEVNEFMNTDSLKTLGGCVVAVVLVVNTLYHIFKWKARWFAGFLALGLSILVFWVDLMDLGTSKNFLILVMVLINACLIYTSAFGLQNSIIAEENDKSSVKEPGIETQSAKRKFNWREKW